jgi:hypothetical protein
MSHFENDGTDGIGSFGVGKTREQIEKDQEAEARAAAFKERREREMAREKADDDKESQARAAEILEKEAIEICMEANPNLSWRDAKLLYDHELKQIIAIERFKTAFFGQPSSARASLGVSKM